MLRLLAPPPDFTDHRGIVEFSFAVLHIAFNKPGIGANRKFKQLFSRATTISPARHTVNCAVFCENPPLAWILRSLRRPVGADFDAR